MELMDSIVFPKENVFEKSLAQIGIKTRLWTQVVVNGKQGLRPMKHPPF
jgi:hypothetical protein